MKRKFTPNVWVVYFCEENEVYVYDTAQKAYDAFRSYISTTFDDDTYEINKYTSYLDEMFEFDSQFFAVPDIGWAKNLVIQ